jgi:glycine reductase
MDMDDQVIIQEAVDSNATQDLVVILGSPDPDSAELYALTMTTGDPTYAGPLAGVQLGLPVYHIFEDEIRAAVDPVVYRDQVGMAAKVLDAQGIVAAVKKVRESA